MAALSFCSGFKALLHVCLIHMISQPQDLGWRKVSFDAALPLIAHSSSPTAYLQPPLQPPTADLLPPTSHLLPPTANSPQPTANSQQPTANSQQP